MKYKTRYWNDKGQIEEGFVDTEQLDSIYKKPVFDKFTESTFLDNVKDHKMEVIRVDGVNRHIRFKKEGTLSYYFDLITWPGHLCIAGDMGTYVFKRLHDMFDFFKTDSQEKSSDTLGVNLSYWAEKLVAKGETEYKFSPDLFIQEISSIFSDYDFKSIEEAQDCFQQLTDDLIEMAVYDDGNFSDETLRQAAIDFTHKSGFSLKSYFEEGFTYEYVYPYTWCCYAIAWGIKQFGLLTNRIDNKCVLYTES